MHTEPINIKFELSVVAFAVAIQKTTGYLTKLLETTIHNEFVCHEHESGPVKRLH
jgi:hypothetical protein